MMNNRSKPTKHESPILKPATQQGELSDLELDSRNTTPTMSQQPSPQRRNHEAKGVAVPDPEVLVLSEYIGGVTDSPTSLLNMQYNISARSFMRSISADHETSDTFVHDEKPATQANCFGRVPDGNQLDLTRYHPRDDILLTADHLPTLVSFLEDQPTVNEIYLTNQSIDDTGAAYLLNQHHLQLTRIHARENRMSQENERQLQNIGEEYHNKREAIINEITSTLSGNNLLLHPLIKIVLEYVQFVRIEGQHPGLTESKSYSAHQQLNLFTRPLRPQENKHAHTGVPSSHYKIHNNKNPMLLELNGKLSQYEMNELAATASDYLSKHGDIAVTIMIHDNHRRFKIENITLKTIKDILNRTASPVKKPYSSKSR